jgi:hypothetical protein
VEELFNLLQRALTDRPAGINFYEVVINPESFSQTIENMFDMAFAVRDGRACLRMNADGMPIVVQPPKNQAELERWNQECA